MRNLKYMKDAMFSAERPDGKDKEKTVSEARQNDPMHLGYHSTVEFERYEALCRGEDPMVRPVLSDRLHPSLPSDVGTGGQGGYAPTHLRMWRGGGGA